MSSLTPEAHEAKLAAGRSIRASKAAATRKRKSASYERQAKYAAAMNAYNEDRKIAQLNRLKMPNIADYIPAGGF